MGNSFKQGKQGKNFNVKAGEAERIFVSLILFMALAGWVRKAWEKETTR